MTPWRKDRILVDPFCGSGTFVIEAAMIAANIAPGMNREFTAEKWTNLKSGKQITQIIMIISSASRNNKLVNAYTIV